MPSDNTPVRPSDESKGSPSSSSGFGETMAAAKRNVMNGTPATMSENMKASPSMSDGLGKMASGMGASREKTLKPSMPPKGSKAPGAT